jgi:hypothetical protein
MQTSRQAMTACGARTRSGGSCGRPAGWGTDHAGFGRCKLHGGATPNGKAAARRQQAEEVVRVYGLPVEIDPSTALLEELARTHGYVLWLDRQVATLGTDEAYGPVGGGKDSFPRAEPHVWIRLLGEERDRLRQIAKACHECRVAEHRMRMAEQMAAVLAVAVGGILREFGLEGDPRAPEVVRRHLATLEAPVIEGSVAA